MATQTATPTPDIFAAFERFISQRSGIESGNYFSPYDNGSARAEGIAAFRAEQRAIANQGKRARAALETAKSFPFNPEAMADALQHSFSGRLSWVETSKGKGLDYTTGQYFPTEYRQAAAVVLETYIHVVTPKTVPAAGARFTTIEQIKAASLASGSHWFDKDSMRFFRTSVYDYSVTQGNDGLVYFVSSEQNGDEPRAYSVRVFNPADASIDTVGDFQGHATKGDALKVAREVAKVGYWQRFPHSGAESAGYTVWMVPAKFAESRKDTYQVTKDGNRPNGFGGYYSLESLLSLKGINTEGGR